MVRLFNFILENALNIYRSYRLFEGNKPEKTRTPIKKVRGPFDEIVDAKNRHKKDEGNGKIFPEAVSL